LRQKLANLNAVLDFGRNDQHGAATSKSRKDTSVCRNVHISFSASWFAGELSSYLVQLARRLATQTASHGSGLVVYLWFPLLVTQEGSASRADLADDVTHKLYVHANYGLFAPKTIRSRERKFQVWNFRSLELSLPPTNVARSGSSTNMYRPTCT